MDKNSRVYNASLHLYNAAMLLDGIHPNLREELLDKAKNLLDEVEINEEEIREIEDYKEKIKEQL